MESTYTEALPALPADIEILQNELKQLHAQVVCVDKDESELVQQEGNFMTIKGKC